MSWPSPHWRSKAKNGTKPPEEEPSKRMPGGQKTIPNWARMLRVETLRATQAPA
jgi:hypothetical protein